MTKRGLYIIIEGIDGAGKDTQGQLLQQFLGEENYVYTREPRGTEVGVTLQGVITNNILDAITEVLLFFAARKEIINHIIHPSLNAGKSVISNRSILTTYAYQVHAREKLELMPMVDYLSAEVMGQLTPDFCIYYDIPVEVRKARMAGRAEQNSFDNFDEGFFERARQGYLTHIQKFPHVVIDASGTIEETHQKTLEVVKDLLVKHHS